MSPEDLSSRVRAFLYGGGAIVQLDYAGNRSGELRGLDGVEVVVAGPARHVVPEFPSAGPARCSLPPEPACVPAPKVAPSRDGLRRLRLDVAKVARRLAALEARVAET